MKKEKIEKRRSKTDKIMKNVINRKMKEKMEKGKKEANIERYI